MAKGQHKSPQPLKGLRSGASIYQKGGTATGTGKTAFKKPVKTSAVRMDK